MTAKKENELEVYLDIGNPGITFKVSNDKLGPSIEIYTSTFGNLQSKLKIYTSPHGLKLLGEMFIKASELEYNEVYDYAARPYKIVNGETKLL